MPISRREGSPSQQSTAKISPSTPRNSRRISLIVCTILLSCLLSVFQPPTIGVSAAPAFPKFTKSKGLGVASIGGSVRHAERNYGLCDRICEQRGLLRKSGGETGETRGQSTKKEEKKLAITTTNNLQKTCSSTELDTTSPKATETVGDKSQQNSATETPTTAIAREKSPGTTEARIIDLTTEPTGKKTQVVNFPTLTERTTKASAPKHTGVKNSAVLGPTTKDHEPVTKSVDFRAGTGEELVPSKTAPPIAKDQTAVSTPGLSLAISTPEETSINTSTATVEKSAPPETSFTEGPETLQGTRQGESDSASSAPTPTTSEVTTPSTIAPLQKALIGIPPTQETLFGATSTQTSQIGESLAPDLSIENIPPQYTPAEATSLLNKYLDPTISTASTPVPTLVPSVKGAFNIILDAVTSPAPLPDQPSATTLEPEATENKTLAISPVSVEGAPTLVARNGQRVQTPAANKTIDQGCGQVTTTPPVGGSVDREYQDNEQNGMNGGNRVTGPSITVSDDTSTQNPPATTTVECINSSEKRMPAPSSILSSQPQTTGGPSSASVTTTLKPESTTPGLGPTVTCLSSEFTTVAVESPTAPLPTISTADEDVVAPITTESGITSSTAPVSVVPTLISVSNATTAIAASRPANSTIATPTDSVATPEYTTALSSAVLPTNSSRNAEQTSEISTLTNSSSGIGSTNVTKIAEPTLRSPVPLKSFINEPSSADLTSTPTTFITTTSNTPSETIGEAPSTAPNQTTNETISPAPGTNSASPQTTTRAELSPVTSPISPPDVVVPIAQASDIPPPAEIAAGTAVDGNGNRVEILAFNDVKNEALGPTPPRGSSMSLGISSSSFVIALIVALVGLL